MVDFTQADFGNSREERRGGNGQRHHSRPDAIGGTDDQACEGDQCDHQDQERDRAEQVDEGTKHPVQGGGFEDSTLAAGNEDDRQRYSGQQGDQ
ncbi:hypothetical protein D3C84_1053910 [compost metagenome]